MNKITDWTIINHIYNLYQGTDRPFNKQEIYSKLLNARLINANGTPSSFAIESGIIGKNNNLNHIDQKMIDRVDSEKHIINLKYIDPLTYYSIQDKATTETVQRLLIDIDVQHTFYSYNNIIRLNLANYINCLSNMVKGLMNDSRVIEDKMDKSKNEIKQCIENRKQDIRYAKRFNKDLEKLPTEYDADDWYECVVWSKIIEWQLKDSIPSDLVTSLSDHFKYSCRNYINCFQPQYRSNEALNAIGDSIADAKLIWKCCDVLREYQSTDK